MAGKLTTHAPLLCFTEELSVDEFLKRFMKTRTLSHERSAKAERLQLQLEALHRAGF